MTYPACEHRDRLGSVHHTAICKEIGEEIWTRLERESVDPSPRLIELMARLRDDRPNSAKLSL